MLQMDELRTLIWDTLYQAQQPISIAELAKKTGEEELEIAKAVNHNWFEIADGQVRIAKSP